MPVPPTGVSFADLAEALTEGIRTGIVDTIDIEACLFSSEEWITRSDSPVAEHLRRRHNVTHIPG